MFLNCQILIGLLGFTAGFLRVNAWQPDYILRVSETTLYSDCQPRQSVVINGTSPGPLLTFQEGQHYWVRVYNDLPDQNTTVHFHGFSQYASPFNDGTPQASGWPIPPGDFYDYEFQLEYGFYGTYWYHSHVQNQVGTAQGPVIVEQVNKTDCPVEYDEEIVMMISDYYHATDDVIIAGLLNTTVFGWLGEPQSLLVNGNAQGVCNASVLLPGQTCGTGCGNNKQLVKPSTRYRVRIISSTSLSYVGLALEGHNMTVFEVDGTYVEPLPVTSLEMGVGQRYSVLIETMDNPTQSDWYWRLRTMWRPTRVNGSALWSYDPSTSSDPFTRSSIGQEPTPVGLNETVPLPDEVFGWVSGSNPNHCMFLLQPTKPQLTLWILNAQQMVDMQGFRWSINGQLNNSTLPNVPYLIQLYNETEDKRMPNYTTALQNGGYDIGSNTYPAKLGEVLDIVIQNRAGPTSGMVEAHPFHTHGAKYWDMGYGPGNFSYTALNTSRASMKGSPYLRDTSVVYSGPGESYNSSVIDDDGPGGWRLFRIKVSDPGAWLIHCHITAHQIMGMQALFMYGAEDLPAIPDSLLAEYLTYGGGSDSFDSHTYVPTSYFETMASLRIRDKGEVDE
ncbi:L-ascorbate oxidase [Tremella mesenterica]|uniref:laccase n=1 Tax=Tremella mesenterica TaxID=5217 RepID=A0A4Q1BJ13_TREME|nr:L-ascorbate oxidase [Tremella mesenterica]